MYPENEKLADMLNRIYERESARNLSKRIKFYPGSVRAFALIRKAFTRIAKDSGNNPQKIVAYFTVIEDHTFFSCNDEDMHEVNFSKSDLIGCMEMAKRNGLKATMHKEGKKTHFLFSFTPSNV